MRFLRFRFHQLLPWTYFSPSFAYAFIHYSAIIAISPFSVKSFFGVFTTFLRNFPFYTDPTCQRVSFFVEWLIYLLKIAGRVFAPRANEIVGKFVTFVHVTANFANPLFLSRRFFHLYSLGFGFDVALIILVRNRLFRV